MGRMHNRKMEISKGFSLRRSCQKSIGFLTDEVDKMINTSSEPPTTAHLPLKGKAFVVL